MALFILGAGATRGCSFVNPRKTPCLPPLDADFFTQLQRISNDKHAGIVKEVIKDIVDLFGQNFNLTLETVFTTLEHMIRMVEFRGDSRDFKLSELVAKRDRLKQAIAAVLEESLMDGKTLIHKECTNHQEFVQKHLRPKDGIISFNYDCVLDYALKANGSDKWNAHYGYGFDLGSRGTHISGDDHWQPDKPAVQEDTVTYYKLHGSLHFNVTKLREGKPKVSLKQRPYTKQNGRLKFDIIPPEWNKKYDSGVFSKLWEKAGDALYHATHIILIGYALPPTDLHSTSLFRTSLKKDSLKSLTIVNPDPAARRQTRAVFQRGLKSNAKVLSFNYWEEFLATERKLWDV